MSNNSDSEASSDSNDETNNNKKSNDINREITDILEAVKTNRVKKNNCFQYRMADYLNYALENMEKTDAWSIAASRI